MRNDSYDGAQAPMQFMPSTWRAHGLGGNARVRDTGGTDVRLTGPGI